jgi:hypothetical protein
MELNFRSVLGSPSRPDKTEQARNAAAALADPPPNPAPTGTRLNKLKSIPGVDG